MKVKVTYNIPVEKIIDLTPEEYCDCRSLYSSANIFPKNAIDKTILIVDKKSENELWDFIEKNEKERG